MGFSHQKGRVLFVLLILFGASHSIGANAQGLSRYEIIDGLARPGGIPSKDGATMSEPFRTNGKGTILTEKSDRVAISELIATLNPARVDVEILFRFGSDELDPAGFSGLIEVAQALKSPALIDMKILIAGHTDGVGGADYNLSLSLRRAISVKHHLVKIHGISDERLIVTGFGSERLKDFLEPKSSVNRRVEFINLSGLVE